MKYASVCSGVEAASLAWMPLGFEAAWFSEIEPFPCAVLKERFPGVPNLGDMTKIKVENLENGDQRFTNGLGADVIVPGGVNLLVGGTPCQGFSVAGKQGGLGDERSVLCLTFTRLLDAMRPEWFVWENVPGVFSTNGGEDFKAFLRAIDEIGYSCAWRVLDAQYTRVDGYPRAVPQRRRRVFVIGHFGSEWEYPASVLFEPDCLQGDSPPRRVKGKGFTTLAERSIGTTGIDEYSRVIRMRAGKPGGGNVPLVQECIGYYPSQHHAPKPCDAPTLTTKNCTMVRGDTPLVQKCFVKTSKPRFKGDCETHVDTGVAPTVNCFDQGDKRANELVAECYAIDSMSSNSMKSSNPHSGFHKEEIAKTLDTTVPNPTKNQGGNVIINAVAVAENIIGRADHNGGNGVGAQEEVAYTQNTSGVMGVAHGLTVRRLLPVECERLMGFPDNWTRIPWKGKPEEECPDSPRYKACGNSMCVNVIRWIGMKIEIVERNKRKANEQNQ